MDGEASSVEIDPNQPEAVRKIGNKSIYNIGIGEYDVTVSSGPSYTTRRQEAAESMVQLTQSNPALFPIIGDLMIRSMDWPMAEEIADRLKLMLPPQIQQAEQKDGEQSPEVMAVVTQAQQAIQERDMQLQQAQQILQQMQSEMAQLKQQVENKQYDAAIKQAELSLKEQELQIKAFEAETNRIEAMQDGSREALIKAQSEVAKASIEADTQLQVANMQRQPQMQVAIIPD
jgi:uncharacterized protein YgiM (DUF1202 family)